MKKTFNYLRLKFCVAEAFFHNIIAYFIILENCFKKKPRYGYLIYSDYMFMIPNKRYLRKKVLKALKDMRLMLKGKFISHEKNLSVCKKCICNNSVCKI